MEFIICVIIQSMNRYFRYKFNKWNYITLILMCVAIIPLTVVNLLRLFNVGNFASLYKGLEIISVTVSLLILVFVAVIIIISRYTINDDYFIMQILMRVKIPLKDIVLLRKDVKSNLLVMYYYDKKLPPTSPVNFMVINIKDDDKLPFVEAMREKNPHIVFELFDKNKDDNNDDNDSKE